MEKNQYFEKVISLFYPDRCVLCDEVIPKNASALCETCEKECIAENYKYFAYGKMPILCLSPYDYHVEKVAKAIQRYKFKDRTEYAPFFARKIADLILLEEKETFFDAVTCVPLHESRQAERGYNQSQLLAKEIAALLSKPYEDTLLKIRETKIQHKLSKEERKKNVRGAYCCIEEAPIFEKRYLLIDDILTTGCTMLECVKMLSKSGARYVLPATIAWVKQ